MTTMNTADFRHGFRQLQMAYTLIEAQEYGDKDTAQAVLDSIDPADYEDFIGIALHVAARAFHAEPLAGFQSWIEQERADLQRALDGLEEPQK